MNWHELIEKEIKDVFRCTEQLISMTDDSELSWKPSSGSNWMTTGQLLMHISTACGVPMKDFISCDSGMPDDLSANELTLEEMLPPAEKMPAVESVNQALLLLAEDKKMALSSLSGCSEEDLDSRPTPALWDPEPLPLGFRLLQMTAHLNQHKTQLFYYLKLMGKPVSTRTLYGI